MIALFHKDWRKSTLERISQKEWVMLSIVAVVGGALAPLLIFTALDKTTVTSVILLTRLEPPLSLALFIFFLRDKVHPFVILGSLITFSGVVVNVLLRGGIMSIGVGEISALSGAIISSVAAVIVKGHLKSVPLGIFFVYRNFLGTIIFYLIAKLLYPPEHFQDAFSPFVIGWMSIYALVIVVAGQLCNLRAIRECSAAQISLSSSVNPLLAIIIAYLLLGEVPTSAQYIGGVVILIGVFISLIGNLKNLPRNMKIVSLDQMQEENMSHQLRI